jgi:short-subunit dehydrogenase
LSIDRSTVLVTGATGGIGNAIARTLSARGARLILTGRRSDVLELLAAELNAQTIVCDLSDRAAVDRLAEEAIGARVDVLVANAALPATGFLVDLTQEELDRMLEVNLRAPIALAHALAPMMTSRHSGHMVFVSSLSGKATGPASSLYSATKFGLRGFALGIRADLRSYGVGASVILPGFVSGAGMFVDAGVRLPPCDVAEAVIRAVEQNRAEVDVAPLSLRLGASFASVAPGVAAWGSRILGSERVGAEYAEGRGGKR